MNKRVKNITIGILIIIEIISISLGYNSFLNRKIKLDEVNLIKENKDIYALYLEDDNGEYEESEDDEWPTEGYKFNDSKSGCIDEQGNKVEGILSYVNNEARVRAKKSVYCYLYFDIAKTLYNVVKRAANAGEIATVYTGEGSNNFANNIYYYRARANNSSDAGNILNAWNVVFAKHCWLLMRTNETGGTRLLYNGKPIVGTDGSGNPTYDCSTSRTNTVGYNYFNQGLGGLSSSTSYYYGTDATYNSSTRKYTLAGDITSSTWTEENANNLIGKYTCKGTAADTQCSQMYIIDEYLNATTARTVVVSNNSNYYSIAYSNPLTSAQSPAYAGYMYNTAYNSQYKYLYSKISRLDKKIAITDALNNYYYSSNYNYGTSAGAPCSTCYTLNSPDIGSNLITGTNYDNIVNKYTFFSSNIDNGTTSNVTKIYYILDYDDNYIYYIELTQNRTASYYSQKYQISATATENADGTHTLTGTIIEKNYLDWQSDPNTYVNYYLCYGEDTTCNAYLIKSNTQYGINIYDVTKLKYSNSFSYELNNETGNYEYVLDMTDENAQTLSLKDFMDSNNVNKLKNAHYTCWNYSGRCETVSYVYYFYSNSNIYYINLTDGKYLDDNVSEGHQTNNILYEMFYDENINQTDSKQKQYMDKWYKLNLLNYDNYMDKDAIYCYERRLSTTGINGFKLNSTNITNTPSFTVRNNLNCPNKESAYSVNETNVGNGALTYSIGPLTYADLYLANFGQFNGSTTFFWTGTVSGLSGINAGPKMRVYADYYGWLTTAENDSRAGIRPAIALKKGIEYTSGTGTTTNPYVVE